MTDESLHKDVDLALMDNHFATVKKINVQVASPLVHALHFAGGYLNDLSACQHLAKTIHNVQVKGLRMPQSPLCTCFQIRVISLQQWRPLRLIVPTH